LKTVSLFGPLRMLFLNRPTLCITDCRCTG